MVVAKTVYGSWFTLVGTLAEVVAALNAEQVTDNNFKSVFYNGTNFTAIYHK